MMINWGRTNKQRHFKNSKTNMVSGKTTHNNQEEQEEVSDEEKYHVDQQYEQDRLTDDNAYSEYFEDDENKADRFTDDYRENFTD
jgi:hypothetical protein